MIHNMNHLFVDTFILFFYQFIFSNGVIPNNFNNTYIVPIIKDKTKPSEDLSNLRPISISNTLAQIFERIIKIKTPELGLTHRNQFGYKNKTSCTHALFAFKETIVKHLEEKKHIFAVQLDAVKAFDRVWRDGLFYKLKNKLVNINTVILMRIYYDKLQAKVKIKNVLSKCFKLTRGVKQGGVLSGDLFNIFIDDLINDCVNSGLGAKFILIILCILCFCDDICLLSSSSDDLRLLLKICEQYALKWAIDFNISKCNFIVFGSCKYNNSIFLLNNSQLNFTEKFKYLGLIFTPFLNMSSFFIDKFQSVKNSFFSLNSFGFRSNGVNPFLQTFVYKSFCISRILYGFEIMTINKNTLKHLNVAQNDLIRYMTGLSRNSHISNTLKILKLFNIFDLYIYMKLIFVKNLKTNFICKSIFTSLLTANYKKSSLSFIKEFKSICITLNNHESYIIENISDVIAKFKADNFYYEETTDNELIKICLHNNLDPIMREQLNFVTYAGPLILSKDD